VEFENELHYLFATKEKQYRIPVSQIDSMFKDYSRKGSDLSGEAMRQKYKLKPEAWGIIKSRLHLQKDSHVISPYTLENLSEDEEDTMIEKVTVDHIDTKIGKFVNTYDKQFKARAMDALKRLANKDYLLDEFKRVLEEYEPVKMDFVPKVIENDDKKMVILTDIHFGKQGHDMVIKRMHTVFKQIVASPERIIYLTVLGDLFEKLSQNEMHP
jgi:predicted nuclease of restriction endonuclease-like (RecB) superfamily